jgi:hypothetical protein
LTESHKPARLRRFDQGARICAFEKVPLRKMPLLGGGERRLVPTRLIDVDAVVRDQRIGQQAIVQLLDLDTGGRHEAIRMASH